MDNQLNFLIFKRILGMDGHQNFDDEIFEPERIEDVSVDSNKGELSFKYNGMCVKINIVIS